MSDNTEAPAANDDTATAPAAEKSPLVGSVDGMFREHFDKLQEEINRIESITKPMRAERDRLQAEIQPTEDKMRNLADEYMKIEQDSGLYQLKMDLARVARAMGGRSLSDGQITLEPPPPVEEAPTQEAVAQDQQTSQQTPEVQQQ